MPVLDFKRDELWVQSFRLDGVKVNTYSGSVWGGITNRCKLGSSAQAGAPCYVGVENKFKDFQSFTDWHINQIGYGKGYHIDKDILFPDSRCYSPENCVLVPRVINNLVKSTQKKSGLPTGVFTNGTNYRACITLDYNSINLGTFKTVEEAVDTYNKAKVQSLAEMAELWKEQIDPRVYEALTNPLNLMREKHDKYYYQ